MTTSNLKLQRLNDTPSWEWPEDAGRFLLGVLRDDQSQESDLLLAVELAGDCVVINDELADALLSILRSSDKPEEIRGTAAIALGPVLEEEDTIGLEDRDDALIAKSTFHGIQESLRTLFSDTSVPEGVRRSILEASVRAIEDWHQEAVRAAFASNDEGWRLTAVFCMRFVRGFEAQILTALDSANPGIHYQAILAAGEWGIDTAWPHIVALVRSDATDKALLLAAIEAVAGIRPHRAVETLGHLADSDDEDIAAAVEESLLDAKGAPDEDDEPGDDEVRH